MPLLVPGPYSGSSLCAGLPPVTLRDPISIASRAAVPSSMEDRRRRWVGPEALPGRAITDPVRCTAADPPALLLPPLLARRKEVLRGLLPAGPRDRAPGELPPNAMALPPRLAERERGWPLLLPGRMPEEEDGRAVRRLWLLLGRVASGAPLRLWWPGPCSKASPDSRPDSSCCAVMRSPTTSRVPRGPEASLGDSLAPYPPRLPAEGSPRPAASLSLSLLLRPFSLRD